MLVVGRLTLRKDGWFSFNSGALLGVLTTNAVAVPPKPLAAPAAHRAMASESQQLELVLLLNILSSVRGVVRAELLDAATGQPLVGHSLNESVALAGHNALQVPLRWSTPHSRVDSSLIPPNGAEGGSMVKIRLESTYTKIFSFELAWRPAPPPPPPPPVVGRAPAFGVDIFDPKHGAYNHSYPKVPWANKTQGALSCQSQCDADPVCAAWTYVETSRPGSPERCCFSASVGCPHASHGVDSGAKVAGPCTPGAL
jgi:hypothetical protein